MDFLVSYFNSLNPMSLVRSLPGNMAQGVIWGIMALGVFITYKLLDFADLTVDSSFTTGAAVAALLIIGGCPASVAMLAAVVSGLLAGLITGLLHTLMGIPGILAGILTQIGLWSVNLLILGGSNLSLNPDRFNLILSSRVPPVALGIGAVFALVLIMVLYWYFGTEQGCAIRSTGSNPNMSQAQGININFIKVLALALSNGLVALAGALLAQFQGFADLNMGRGAIVIGLAAVIIGSVFFDMIFRKHQNFAVQLVFVIIGGVIYYLVTGLVLWLKMPPNLMKLFTAIVVAIFLAIPYLLGKKRSSFARAGKRGAQQEEEEGVKNA